MSNALLSETLAPTEALNVLSQILAQLQNPVGSTPSPFPGNIDPALYSLSATTHDQLSTPSSSLPGSVPANTQVTDRRQCRGRNLACKGVVPGACTNCMCKGCCEADPTTCAFKNHNGGKRPVTSSQNPAHLPRPLPAAPYLVSSTPFRPPTGAPSTLASVSAVAQPNTEPRTSALNLSVITALTPTTSMIEAPTSNTFSFKKPIPTDLKEDYVRQCRERDKRREVEALKARHQLRLKQSVTLIAYFDDDQMPIMRPLQGLLSWPSLNFSEILDDLALLFEVSHSTILELEAFISIQGIKSWIPVKLDFSIPVHTDDVIYLRKRGSHAGPTAVPHTLYSGAATTPRKRKTMDSPDTARPRKAHRLDLGPSSLPSSPSPLPTQPGSESDAFTVFDTPPTLLLETASDLSDSLTPAVSTSTTSALLASPTHVEDDPRDETWSLGYVTTPLETHLKWPQGMYVRDMAEGFDILTSGRKGGGTLSDRFPVVFRGIPWVSATYQKNRKFWMELAPEVRLSARALPRTNQGLWEVWRKTQSSWR
ncbi:hypothetical protein BJ165DRAFT_1540592 [Panaeolus papilionaceus]|nr:hypothetical protein BJ165DRAFT_1540592 [Panaeolus papilionaceus]